MKVTYKIAMAAGQDAGNKQMKSAGRTSWNEDDFNLAADMANRVMAS